MLFYVILRRPSLLLKYDRLRHILGPLPDLAPPGDTAVSFCQTSSPGATRDTKSKQRRDVPPPLLETLLWLSSSFPVSSHSFLKSSPFPEYIRSLQGPLPLARFLPVPENPCLHSYCSFLLPSFSNGVSFIRWALIYQIS